MTAKPASRPPHLEKAPTGIAGLDEITGGGLPRGRPTLVCGAAGCGKSLMATEFLVRGAVQFGEPGVMMTFDESAEDIAKNAGSLGFDLPRLIRRKQLLIDHVRVERSEIEENGEYDLEGLFIRIGFAIDQIGAKRVVLDTIETLFAGLKNEGILRAELRRLFGWLRERRVTAVITGERGEGQLTRHGIEEYVSDCVILLDHRVGGQISTRRLRVVKYRGSTHGTNEYPFLIDAQGMSVLPITASGMDYGVSNRRVTSGIAALDEMLGGAGYFEGSTVMLSGTAGTGKTSVAAHLAEATCRRGERCLYFSFEESPAQLIRNMRSIGVDLERPRRRGLLRFHSTRPTVHGIEMHLVQMHKLIGEFRPAVVIVDPVSNLHSAGTLTDSTNLLIRLVDFLRKRNILAFFVTLTQGGGEREATDEGMSSMVDTWLLLRDIETSGERNRVLYVLKARGIAHSNQMREFLITSRGVQLVPIYTGPGGVLTGSARLTQEADDRAEQARLVEELAKQERLLKQRRRALEAQIATLQSESALEEAEIVRAVEQSRRRIAQVEANRQEISRSRRAAASAPPSS